MMGKRYQCGKDSLKQDAVRMLLLFAATLWLPSACGQRGPLPPPDKTPPVIHETVPAQGFSDFPVTGAIKAMFSKEMDPSTINGQTMTLSSASGEVPGSVVYTDATAIFAPLQILKEGTLYTVTVSDTVKDVYGILMGQAFKFSFSTQTYPGILSTLPAKNAADVPVNAGISVAFNKPINPESLRFSLISEGLGTIPCDPVLDAKGMNAQFIPRAAPPEPHGLKDNTRYTATVSAGLLDVAGNMMAADYVWTFTTGAVLDTRPPEVKATVPANGSTDVSVNPSISVEFSEPVNSSLTTTLTLSSAGAGTVGCQRIAAGGTVHTFTPLINPPAVSLAYNAFYTATVSPGVQDGAGNRMNNAYSWAFKTSLAPTLMTIVAPDVPYGSNVAVQVTVTSVAGIPAGTVMMDRDGGSSMTQTLDPNGRAAFTIVKPALGIHILNATYEPPNGSIFQGSSGSIPVGVGQNAASMSLTTSLNPAIYGAPVAFTATVPDGATGTVTFRDGSAVLGEKAVSDGTAVYSSQALGAGTHAITASYGGDANFAASMATLTPAQRVDQAALTVTANDASRDFGAANPQFTAGYAGFVNGETNVVLSGSPLLSTTATATSPPGSYVITANRGTIAAANYSFTFIDGTLTISNANAVVTLGSLSQIYDGAPKAATAATNPPDLSVVITYNGSSAPPVNAGSYTVVAVIHDQNYQGSVSGTLTISKATAAVTLGNLNHAYDGAPKVATATTDPPGLAVALTYNGSPTPPVNAGGYTVLGIVNDINYQGSSSGSDIMTISKPIPVVSWPIPDAIVYGEALSETQLNATANIPGAFVYSPASGVMPNAGTQNLSVTFTPADIVNYAVAAADVTLTVSARPITITADAKTKLHGDPDPVLTYSITSGSLVNGDVLNGALTRANGEGAGDYAILLGTLGNGNYQITYIGASLTIQ